MLGDVFLFLQGTCTILALIFNTFLIYVIVTHKKNTSIGKYKWLLVTFAGFEMTYAIVVFFGMPVNFIADSSWLVFNHGGFIGGTRFATIGPTLYCTFYELWIGFVVVHFVYRYVALCRRDLKQKIQERVDLKVILLVIYSVHFFYCFTCGIFFCTRSEMSPRLFNILQDQFGIGENEHIGFILLRTKNLDGSFSPGGFASIMNHYILVLTSVCIILFCGFNIWAEIKRMQQECVNLKDFRTQRQIFFTLLAQTIIPIFLCHIPSIIYLTFPFFNVNVSLGPVSAIFSLLTAIPKFLDPLIVLHGIRDYRLQAKKVLLRKNNIVRVVTMSTAPGHGITTIAGPTQSQPSQPTNEETR